MIIVKYSLCLNELSIGEALLLNLRVMPCHTSNRLGSHWHLSVINANGIATEATKTPVINADEKKRFSIIFIAK